MIFFVGKVTGARILLSFIVGMSVFGALQTFFHLSFWASLVIAVASTLVTWLERGLALYDKSLDVRKKSIELEKLKREEKERDQFVKSATPQEIQKHVVECFERDLKTRGRFKTQEAVRPNPFISDSREGKF